MSQETIVAIVIAIIGSGGSGVFVTWILSKVDQRHDPLHEGVRELLFCKLEALHRQMVDAGGVCEHSVEAKRGTNICRLPRSGRQWNRNLDDPRHT